MSLFFLSRWRYAIEDVNVWDSENLQEIGEIEF